MTSSSTTYQKRFLDLHDILAKNYFNKDGIPYHALETVVIEAQDHGRLSTSEAASFWIYYEALYGFITGDWQPLKKSWDVTEEFFIPKIKNYDGFNPQSPARYAPEHDTYERYPSELSWSVPVGKDPTGERLKSAHGTVPYSMHWLVDPDEIYGFGKLINTFQRGPMESCWKTVPHGCVDDLKHGGPNGFLDLYVKQDGKPPPQERYTLASDADARAIQAIFWAQYLAEKKNEKSPILDDLVKKAAKMGDWLTPTMYDKYFVKLGTDGNPQAGASEEDSWHGLLGWYTSYGAPMEKQGWAFRIGCAHSHMGYQNVLGAYAMARSFGDVPTTKRMWEKSLSRQIEMYCWLQSREGAISGGCTSSWNGRYEKFPEGTKSFYKCAYTPHPVYADPPSNQWSGMQGWGMERVVQLYFLTRDNRLGELVRNWVKWVVKNTKVSKDGKRALIPSTLKWTGQPDADWDGPPTGSNGADRVPKRNQTLQCEVTGHGRDLGIMASFARSLMFFNAVRPNAQVKRTIRAILSELDCHLGDKGYSVEEAREDYKNLDAKVYVPPGWVGKTPNGEPIDGNSTFFSIRKSILQDDPMYKDVRRALDAKSAPKIRVHRFWGQAEILLTFGFAALFEMNPCPLDVIRK